MTTESTSEVFFDVVLVGGFTRVPIVHKTFQEVLKGKEINRSINPDEDVGSGATVLPAIFTSVTSSQAQDLLLPDTTSPSIGLETIGGVMMKLIEQHHHSDEEEVDVHDAHLCRV